MKTLLTTAAIVAMMSGTVMARGVIVQDAPAAATQADDKAAKLAALKAKTAEANPWAGQTVGDQLADLFNRGEFNDLPGELKNVIRSHVFMPASDKSFSYLSGIKSGEIHDKASADRWESRYDAQH